ncbi:protein-disulfide isomerase [Streptomyces sp. BK022]|uniref:DsbA family protein n=1 Tax=Streptomyces sp. BK022 TaxID=2512123 RepID=UPI001029A586|nr:DsbA family protein [Streptomyces sp. BK022]RZU37837.1 protein-disulfide isomerase [Streptomyces sp. BK022]
MSTLSVPVNSDDHIQGSASAPVTLVEYGDYQCSYCGEAFGVIKRIQEEFGDALRFVFRNFPLPEIHPEAMSAAVTAEYCGSQGHFWPAHDALYKKQATLGKNLYAEIVEKLGLDVDGLHQAFDKHEFAQRIQGDIDSGIRSGVNGTPAFFINGEKYQVKGSFDELAEPIRRIVTQSRE